MSDLLANIADDTGGWLSAGLDLVIVFYIVYVVLLLIRGTRAVPMSIGLILLVALYLISRVLGLATTYVLLDQFMSVVVIFVVIVFQDDIRRALARVGRFARFSKARESQVVEEVIRAADMMASRRIGAIVVFERTASLDDFIVESGTRIDAAVSRELLMTIFMPEIENPLHDGAVVIRDFRLLEAGAFLPLSSNQRLDKAMGTRHRAALGITEETDAVAVVVSEERAAVSLCHAGRITTNLDSKALRRALLELFSEGKKGRRDRAESGPEGEGDDGEAADGAEAGGTVGGDPGPTADGEGGAR